MIEKHTLVTVRCPESLEHPARVLAAHMRVSKSELVRRAVADYLERVEPIREGQQTQGGE